MKTSAPNFFQCLKRCYEVGLHNIVSDILQSNFEEFGGECNWDSYSYMIVGTITQNYLSKRDQNLLRKSENRTNASLQSVFIDTLGFTKYFFMSLFWTKDWVCVKVTQPVVSLSTFAAEVLGLVSPPVWVQQGRPWISDDMAILMSKMREMTDFWSSSPP